MGATKGPSIHELIEVLEPDEARKRIEKQLIPEVSPVEPGQTCDRTPF